MLSEKRIKEAESNIKIYLEEGLLKKTTEKIPLKIFLKNAKESLKAAKILYDNEIYLWTIVTSYYSMFYIANAELINLEYKTGDKIVHKVMADALIVFVRNKLKKKLLENYEKTKEEAMKIANIKSDEMIEFFDFERKKRSSIQYHTPLFDIKMKAQTSLKRAKEFLFEIEELIDI